MNRRSRGWRSRRSFPRRNRQRIQGSLNPPAEQGWETFAKDLAELESGVQALRQRFETVRSLQLQQQSLQQQMQAANLSPDQLKQLQKQLDELTLQLESSLLDWRSLLEPFWQAVRFGGLGIIIGWILRTISQG